MSFDLSGQIATLYQNTHAVEDRRVLGDLDPVTALDSRPRARPCSASLKFGSQPCGLSLLARLGLWLDPLDLENPKGDRAILT